MVLPDDLPDGPTGRSYPGVVLRLLVVLAVVGLHVYALLDCIRTSPAQVRGLPFAAWMLLVLFLPAVGPMLWLWSGRPEAFDPVGRRR